MTFMLQGVCTFINVFRNGMSALTNIKIKPNLRHLTVNLVLTAFQKEKLNFCFIHCWIFHIVSKDKP